MLLFDILVQQIIYGVRPTIVSRCFSRSTHQRRFPHSFCEINEGVKLTYQAHSRLTDSVLFLQTKHESLYAAGTNLLSLILGFASSSGTRYALSHYCSRRTSLANPERLSFCLYLD